MALNEYNCRILLNLVVLQGEDQVQQNGALHGANAISRQLNRLAAAHFRVDRVLDRDVAELCVQLAELFKHTLNNDVLVPLWIEEKHLNHN